MYAVYWNWILVDMWVLGIKPRSFGRADFDLNHQVISAPSTLVHFFEVLALSCTVVERQALLSNFFH